MVHLLIQRKENKKNHELIQYDIQTRIAFRTQNTM
jgi:hypothetical protein